MTYYAIIYAEEISPYTVHCTLYTVNCTVYSTLSVEYKVQCTSSHLKNWFLLNVIKTTTLLLPPDTQHMCKQRKVQKEFLEYFDNKEHRWCEQIVTPSTQRMSKYIVWGVSYTIINCPAYPINVRTGPSKGCHHIDEQVLWIISLSCTTKYLLLHCVVPPIIIKLIQC